jgi:hypothetical protein
MLVLDTGVIYNDIIYRLRHPDARGALIGSALSGTTVLIAGEHVYDEVYDSLVGHERRGFTRERVLSVFERIYLPQIRFVSVPRWPVAKRVLPVALADPDDVPTAALALLLAPSLVFAIDPHLVEAGFGRAQDWLSLTFQADQLLGYDGTLLTAALAVSAAGRVAAKAARWFAQDLRPIDVAAGVAVAVGLTLIAPRAADATARTLQRGGNTFGRASREVAVVLGQILVQRGENTTALHTASVLPDLPPGLDALLARFLATTWVPQSTVALAQRFGHQPATVQEILERHPAFVHNGLGWQLGRRRLARGREISAGTSR